MKRARLIALTLVAVVAAASAVAARGAGDLQITSARAAFPERALVLTLPTGMALDRQSVRVLENGQPVARLQVIPARQAAARSFGFVLALDASNSMRGAAETGALAAVRAFADERSGGAALGLVAFNSRIQVLLKPSMDATAIDSALSRRPRLVEGTRMRDAVAQAIALLARSGVRAGSVVVLSDGADIGSRTSTAELVRLARTNRVRLFTVGLRSPQFDPAALRALADGTGGHFIEATSAAALAPLYHELGSELASEYLVRYRSEAPAGSRVHVTVQIPLLGATATLTYDVPGAAGFHQSWQERFWRSWIGIAATVALVALLASLVVLLVLRALRPGVDSRIAAYVRQHPRTAAKHDESVGTRIEQVLDRSFSHLWGWRRFAEDVEIARLPASAVTLSATAAAASVLLVLVAILAREPFVLVFALVPPVVLRSVVKVLLKRVRRRFEEELPDNVQVLASALRAGHGLSGALGVVARDAIEPACSEFERALADERLGMPLEDALSAVAERMASTDLEQIALVAALHRQTGGNTAEVLDRVHDVLRERAELRRMVLALTAEGRLSRWVLTALPVVVGLAIMLLGRDYISPLIDTTGGRLLLVVAAGMVAAGSWVVKRIVEIEV